MTHNLSAFLFLFNILSQSISLCCAKVKIVSSLQFDLINHSLKIHHLSCLCVYKYGAMECNFPGDLKLWFCFCKMNCVSFLFPEVSLSSENTHSVPQMQSMEIPLANLIFTNKLHIPGITRIPQKTATLCWVLHCNAEDGLLCYYFDYNTSHADYEIMGNVIQKVTFPTVNWDHHQIIGDGCSFKLPSLRPLW